MNQLFFLLFSFASCMAAEQTIIEGSLVLDSEESAWYNPFAQDACKAKLDITCDLNEPMLFVKAFQGTTDTKKEIRLPSNTYFPGALPYFLLKEKKEGDTIEIIAKGTKILLTCRQMIFPHEPPERFEEKLAWSMELFEKSPMANPACEEKLIDAGIISKSTKAGKYRQVTYHHGSNGYRFK